MTKSVRGLLKGTRLSHMAAYEDHPREAESAVKLSGDALPYAAYPAYTYARNHDQLRARSVLHTLQTRAETEYVSPFHFALIYFALDEFDLAFEFLDRSLEERVMRMASGELFDSSFERLNRDHRFDALVSRLAF